MFEDILRVFKILEEEGILSSIYLPVFLKMEENYGFICLEYSSLNISDETFHDIEQYGWIKYEQYLAYPLLVENE